MNPDAATRRMRDAIIVCTRNRPDDVSRCLKSIEGQTREPSLLLVVDSSDSPTTQDLMKEFAERSPFPVEYLRTAPGLTYQRNRGINHMNGSIDVLHFIDDDTELARDYTKVMMERFEADSAIGALSGNVLGDIPSRPSRLVCMTLQGSRRPGVLLKSGYNIGCFLPATDTRVHWLPGCSMSYRASTIAGLTFDETRTGYSMGEDVDFSVRVAERALMYCIPEAEITHHQSPTNRHSSREKAEMSVRHRWSMAKQDLGGVRRRWIVYAGLSEAALLALRSLRRRNPLLLSQAVGVLDGLRQCVRQDLVGRTPNG